MLFNIFLNILFGIFFNFLFSNMIIKITIILKTTTIAAGIAKTAKIAAAAAAGETAAEVYRSCCP